MARKRRSFLGRLFGLAAVAGAAAAVSNLEKQAKEQGRDISEVAKEKYDNIIQEVKSGEALQKAKNFAEKTVNDVNSGEFQENLKVKINQTVESVKSGEFADKAKQMANNVKDGVTSLIDSASEEFMQADEVVEDVSQKVEEVVENINNEL